MLKSEACKRGESVSFASNFSFQRLFSSGCTRVGLSEDCHPRLRQPRHHETGTAIPPSSSTAVVTDYSYFRETLLDTKVFIAAMTRGNQREKAREKNLKEQSGAVGNNICWSQLYQTRHIPHNCPSMLRSDRSLESALTRPGVEKLTDALTGVT